MTFLLLMVIVGLVLVILEGIDTLSTKKRRNQDLIREVLEVYSVYRSAGSIPPFGQQSSGLAITAGDVVLLAEFQSRWGATYA